MKDVIAIVIVLGFFALAAAYVAWCERIIARDANEQVRSDRTEGAPSPDRSTAEDALSGSRP